MELTLLWRKLQNQNSLCKREAEEKLALFVLADDEVEWLLIVTLRSPWKTSEESVYRHHCCHGFQDILITQNTACMREVG